MKHLQVTPPSKPSDVILTGHSLTIEDIVAVSRLKAFVKAGSESLARVQRSHELLLAAARQGLSIYGLNKGVGPNNKNKKIFYDSVLSPKARKISEEFNINLLYSHSAGVGPELGVDIVRATMLARVNTLLLGQAGCQPKVIQMYLDFLNNDLNPVMFSRGSAGEADINILAHIGLAMMGKGQVVLNGKRMEAHEALERVGLEVLRPYAKDALSIVSSNAYSAGLAALVIHDVENFLSKADLVFALSLEGLNGNIAPLLQPVNSIRPYVAQGLTAQKICDYLEGSYLWQFNTGRSLQDPLSFRNASQIHGTTRQQLDFLKTQLLIQLNSSDDNPAVILDASPTSDSPSQALRYFVETKEARGMVVPTGNFEPLPYVLGIEILGIALGHMSSLSCQRTTRLTTPEFTGLSSFLALDRTSFAFSTIQKTLNSLYTEIRHLCNPVSLDYAVVANGVEDHATNAALAVVRLAQLLDNSFYILGMELLHAAQAIDLRLRQFQTEELPLGKTTQKLYKSFRKQVPILDQDRPLTYDINSAYKFLIEEIIEE